VPLTQHKQQTNKIRKKKENGTEKSEEKHQSP
jgi:hypothetical protein